MASKGIGAKGWAPPSSHCRLSPLLRPCLFSNFVVSTQAIRKSSSRDRMKAF